MVNLRRAKGSQKSKVRYCVWLIQAIMPVLFLICIFTADIALAAKPLVLSVTAERMALGGLYLDVLEDKKGLLTIFDASSPHLAHSFKPSHQEVPNFGMTDSTFWFRFTVKSDRYDINDWFLLLDQPLIDEIDLYVQRDDGSFDVKKSGDARPMDDSAVQERNILLPLPLIPDSRTFYLRVWVPGRAIFPFTLLTKDAYRKAEIVQGYITGGYSGFLLAISLLGFFLFLLLRERFYLGYTLYVLGILLSMLMIHGHLQLPADPEHPWLYHFAKALIWSIPILAGTAFARSFLKTKIHAVQLDRLLKWFMFLFSLFIVIYPLIPPLIGKIIINGALPVSSVIAIAAAIFCYRKGFSAALYFLGSRCSIYIGSIIFSLVNMGFLPFNPITKNIYSLATFFDIVFILLALGHHYKGMNRHITSLVKNLKGEVNERTAANRALEEQMAERKRLEREIVRISDEERRNISQELHDGLCQQLTALRLRFDALKGCFTATGLEIEVRPLDQLLEEALNLAYRMSRGLWTPGFDGKGVIINLSDLVKRLSEQSGIPIVLRQKQGCSSCIGESLSQVHYIAREAMFNAVKHANATRIDVLLECEEDKGILLEVRDNGAGINSEVANEGSLGIRIMKHRSEMIGGTLWIGDTEDGGTCVVCNSPCNTK